VEKDIVALRGQSLSRYEQRVRPNLVPCPNLVLFASTTVCCAGRPATRYRAAREPLPRVPTAFQGSKCVCGGLKRSQYQVEGRYQVRANACLLSPPGFSESGIYLASANGKPIGFLWIHVQGFIKWAKQILHSGCVSSLRGFPTWDCCAEPGPPGRI